MSKKQGRGHASSTGGPGPRNMDQTNWRRRIQESRTKFDDDRKATFLQRFAECGRMYESAQAADISYATVSKHLKDDPEFAEAFGEAREAYKDLVHRTAYKVGVEGYDEPMIGGKDKNEVVAHKRVYATNILAMEMRRVDPSYKERSEIDMNLNGGVMLLPGEMSLEEWMEKYGKSDDGDHADQ